MEDVEAQGAGGAGQVQDDLEHRDARLGVLERAVGVADDGLDGEVHLVQALGDVVQADEVGHGRHAGRAPLLDGAEEAHVGPLVHLLHDLHGGRGLVGALHGLGERRREQAQPERAQQRVGRELGGAHPDELEPVLLLRGAHVHRLDRDLDQGEGGDLLVGEDAAAPLAVAGPSDHGLVHPGHDVEAQRGADGQVAVHVVAALALLHAVRPLLEREDPRGADHLVVAVAGVLDARHLLVQALLLRPGHLDLLLLRHGAEAERPDAYHCAPRVSDAQNR